MKIFIDPGHGGSDAGAINGSIGLKEANVNLDVSRKLGQILQSCGHSVKCSRTVNENVSLSSRAKMANEWDADFYISIHCGSTDDANETGTETACFRLGTTAEKLARNVQSSIVNMTGLQDNGIKAQNTAVLRLTRMPAIFVGLAYISNDSEAQLLVDNQFRQKCAQGVADGIGKVIDGGW